MIYILPLKFKLKIQKKLIKKPRSRFAQTLQIPSKILKQKIENKKQQQFPSMKSKPKFAPSDPSNALPENGISWLKKRLIEQFVLEEEDEEGLEKCLREMMEELEIQYDVNNETDFYEQAYIMCELLQYPNSAAAEVHCRANRIGNKDRQRNNKVQFDRKCPCCGLILQQKDVELDIKIEHLQNIGTSTFYFTFTFAICIVLLVAMSVIFGIFSTISNFSISRTYKEDTNASMSEKMFQSYQIPSAFSFGSQQFHPTSFARVSVILQGYLGILALLLCNCLLDVFKYFGDQTDLQTQMQKHSASSFSLFCNNLPLADLENQNKIQGEIQQKLSPLLKQHQFEDMKIKIKKINPINPFNVSVDSLPSKYQYESKTLEVKKQAEVFREWMRQRKHSLEFSEKSQQKRKEQYLKFLDLRKQRYQLYKKLVQEYEILVNNDPESQQLTHKDAFVTFNYPFVPYFILQTEKQKEGLIRDISKYFNKKQMYWTSAPQPEDVKWENYGQGAWEKLFRNLVTVVITISVLSASFFLLYNLSRFKLSALANNSGSKDGFVIDFFVSIGLSIPIYAINFFIKMLFNYLARNWERNTTNSAEQASLARKTLLAMLLNSIGIPVLINLIYRQNIQGVDGLADEIFYFALTNSILSPALKILNIGFCINRLRKWYCHWVCNKWNMNQRELNVNTEYMPFEIGLESASIIFTFLYTCFFAPLQPIILLFSALSLYFSFKASVFVMLRMSKRPISCNAQIHNQVAKLIYFGPLLFAIGGFCWTDLYAISVSHYRVTNFLALALSILALYVARYGLFFAKFKKAVGEQPLDLKKLKRLKQSYDYEKWYFPTEYDRLNPSTMHEAQSEFNDYLLQKCNEPALNSEKTAKENVWRNSMLRELPGLAYDDWSYLKYGRTYVYQ